MKLERQFRVEQLVEAALELGEEQRCEFLEQQCAGDQNLRHEVESLLAFAKDANKFMEASALQVAAQELAGKISASQALDTADDQSLGGRIIAHYRVLSKLGSGGMGVVYEAEDLRLRRHVAIKFLPGELACDPEVFERFQREARTASALDHKNICSIYQLGEHEGKPFIVMQLLRGQTLRYWIEHSTEKPTATRVRELVDYSVQIIEGLQAAHKKGILHRDIKPANLFLTEEGHVKILDFGLAKFLAFEEPAPTGDGHFSAQGGDGTRLTQTGVYLGTPSYLSPEQIRGESLDGRTDLFSLGLVLYEMATGKRAFAGETGAEIREAILNTTPEHIRKLNPALPAELERIVSKALEKDRIRRYKSAHEMQVHLDLLREHRRRKRKREWGVAALVLLAAVAWQGYRLAGRSTTPRVIPKLSERDTVVIGDFSNHTGDPVFDESLKQAFSMELSQSPFFNVASDLQVSDMLRRMGRQGARLTQDLAGEVCLRMGGKAMFVGTISALGSHYIIGLEALGCGTGETLAVDLAEAENKESVLKALEQVGSKVRVKVGESVGSLEKYDFPVNATTSSLDALKALSVGLKAERETGVSNALPFYEQAVHLDRKFALAYAVLGRAYEDYGEDNKAIHNYILAFQLRDRLSERERYFVDTLYFETVTGDLEKAESVGEMWTTTYPQDTYAREKLGTIYADLGRFEKAYVQLRKAVELDTASDANVYNLTLCAIDLNRFDEADELLREARTHGMDGEGVHTVSYLLAFEKGNLADMQREFDWAIGKPEIKALFLELQSETEAFYGLLRNARELSQRARKAAVQNSMIEVAANGETVAAVRELETGNLLPAIPHARTALSLSSTRSVKLQVALALARTGNSVAARALLKQIQTASPDNTLIKAYWTPIIEASLALRKDDPARAISILEPSIPYELAMTSANPSLYLYANYIRGEAYLAMGDGNAARNEFKNIVEHRGVVQNGLLGALSRLQMARAEVAVGNRAEAQKWYSDFLSLWKNADPDIPILKQAKAEYAKLN